MENERLFPDDCADVWELAIFCAKEAYILRSLLEYLRTWPDSDEKKRSVLMNWKQQVGLNFGNPSVDDPMIQAFQRVRDAPPEFRAEALRLVVSNAHSKYFGDQ
jgi:hypothetical protein